MLVKASIHCHPDSGGWRRASLRPLLILAPCITMSELVARLQRGMSEPLAGLSTGPKPGTTLKAMEEENRYLSKFMVMVKAKYVMPQFG
jgi:hypothetical protein